MAHTLPALPYAHDALERKFLIFLSIQQLFRLILIKKRWKSITANTIKPISTTSTLP